MMVVTFALIGTAAVLMNNLAHDPNLGWTVYVWAPVFLVLLVAAVRRALTSFGTLSSKVEKYLKMVEDGQKIPDFETLIRLERKGYLSRLLIGKKSTSSS